MTAPSQQAFPEIQGDGMTLGQYYAGQALVGWLSNEISMQAAARALKQDSRNGPSFIARSAFEIAEAMIAADTGDDNGVSA